MASPDLETWVNRQQRDHFACAPTRDDDHAGAAIGDDLLQKRGHPRIGESLLPIEAEWREGTVIVEQKRGGRRLCHRFHELFDIDWFNRAGQPQAPHPQAAVLARSFSLLSSDASRRSSQSSAMRLPAQRETLCSLTVFRMRCIRNSFSSGSISRATRIASAVWSIS